MAITAKLLNKAEIHQKLQEIPDKKAKQAMRSTINDLKNRGPAVIAKLASQTYNLPRTKLNPKTKAGSSRGYVHATGESLGSIAWHYSGAKLKIGGGSSNSQGSFPLIPSHHITSGYIAMTQILRGSVAVIGHWLPPHSEGGRYSGHSPYFIHPTARLMFRRTSPGHVGFGEGPMVGLSIPQMVLSERTKDQLSDELSEMAIDRFTHYLERALG